MLRLTLRRLGAAALALFGISIIMFLLLNVIPGDPVAGLLPPSAGAEDRERLREHMGLTESLPVQYVTWLVNLAQGDLGYSFTRRADIVDVLGPAIANTMILAAAALLLAVVIGVPLGLIAGLNRGKAVDRLSQAFMVGGMSIPNFWLAMLLVIVFAAQLHLLPASGMGSPDEGPLDFLAHLTLPAISLAVIPLGVIARSTRTSIIEVSGEDFVDLLRAKHLPRTQVLRHLVRNASPPIVTIGGLQVGFLLSGSVLIETIFAWPGLGYITEQSISNRDAVLTQSCVLIVAVIFVIVNLLVDLVQIPLNPRLRASGV
jgi:peptide/nickel transport system permease protein